MVTYAIFFGAIASGGLWIATLIARVMVERIQGSPAVTMSLSSGQPRFVRIASSARTDLAKPVAMVFGLTVGVGILIAMWTYVQRAAGTDPVWLRISSVALASVAVAWTAWQTFTSMPRATAGQDEEFTSLTKAVDEVLAAYYSAAVLAPSRQHMPLPPESWDFLAPAFESSSHFEQVASRLLADRRAHYLHIAEDLRRRPATINLQAGPTARARMRVQPRRTRVGAPVASATPVPTSPAHAGAAASTAAPTTSGKPSFASSVRVDPQPPSAPLRTLEIETVADALKLLGLPDSASAAQVRERLKVFREISVGNGVPEEFTRAYARGFRILTDTELVKKRTGNAPQA